MIFPERVFGSASVKRISSGRASAPISLTTWSDSAFFSSGDAVDAVLQRHEAEDRLPLQLVRRADDGRLGDARVGDQRALDLGGAEAMAGDVQHVVDAPHDPEVAVLVLARRRRP